MLFLALRGVGTDPSTLKSIQSLRLAPLSFELSPQNV